MPGKPEKFYTPESLKELELEEGLADYEELKRMRAVTKSKERIEREKKEIPLVWQSHLDQAFQKGNFDLVKILLRAKPEKKPNPEIVRTKLNELIMTRLSNWERIYSYVQAVSDEQPDQEVVATAFNELFDQFGREEQVLHQLQALKHVTGFVPTNEQIQEKYRSFLHGYWHFPEEDLFRDVQSLTGIPPDAKLFDEVKARGDLNDIQRFAPIFGVEITSELLQSTYESIFEKTGSLFAYTIASFPEKPRADLMQRVYAKILEEKSRGWIDAVQALEKETKIKPDFSNEQVQSIFEDYLSKEWYGKKGYIGIEQVIELTGIKPSPEVVQKRAIQIINKGYGYIDPGQQIKKGIKKLKSAIGEKIEIPESAIQESYQQAITDNKPHYITSLFDAFGIKAAIDKKRARQFMLSQVDSTFRNPVKKLEEAFGSSFSATDEEVSEKYDENFKKLDFKALKQIKKLTGKDWDEEKLKTALIRKLKNEAMKPPHERVEYEDDWPIQVKQLFDDFGIEIPKEAMVKMYVELVQNETIFSKNLAKIYEITGVPLSSELAQKAYRNILAPDYVSSVKTSSFTSTPYDRASTFAVIFEVSGNTKHEVPEKEVQEFYRTQLELGWDGIGEIEHISEVTGIVPRFEEQDVQNLYKRYILDGKADRIKDMQEVTKIDLRLDDEVIEHITETIQSTLNEVSKKDYTKEEGDKKYFESHRFENDLRVVEKLVKATGIKPDREQLQQIYDHLLTQEKFWAIRIEKITKATEIDPVFNQEQLQIKGAGLLENGYLRGFERLLKYGDFEYDPEVVGKGYQALIDANRRYDDYERRYYYEKNWPERLLKLKELSGVDLNDSHLSQVFLHYLQDPQYTHQDYNPVSNTSSYLEENFGKELDEEFTQLLYMELIKKKDYDTLGRIKKKTGVVPDVQIDILKESADSLLENEQWDDLRIIKYLFELEQIPVSPEKLQAVYAKLLGSTDFLKENSDEQKTFFLLQKLIGIAPEISDEQANQIFTGLRFRDWQKFTEAFAMQPSEETVQEKYFQFLTRRHWKLADDLKAVETLSGFEIDESTVKRALEYFALAGEVAKMKTILETTVMRPEIDPDVIQVGCKKAIEGISSNYRIEEKIFDVMSFFYDELGTLPNQEVLGLAYEKLFGKTAVDFAKEDPGGRKEYPQWWTVLKKKFGMPDGKAIQQIYFRQFDADVPWDTLRNFEYIQQFTGVKPNIDKIVRVFKESGKEMSREKIERKLQTIYQKVLLAGQLDKMRELQNQWGVPFNVSAGEAQILYARILLKEGENQEAVYRFMIEYSGHEPDQKIVQNQYKELLVGNEFRLNDMLDFWDLTGIKPSSEVTHQADEKWSQSNLYLIRFVQLLGTNDFLELFPKTHKEVLQKITEQLEDDIDLADYFFENLHAYHNQPWIEECLAKAVQHYSVANKFINAHKTEDAVWKKQPWVENVLQQAQVAIDKGPPVDAWSGESNGAESEGFIYEDPFENHPHRRIRSSLGLGKVMNEKISLQEAGLELSPEATEALEEINKLINQEHQDFLQKFDQSSAVPDEDKQVLVHLNQDIAKMNDLLPNTRNFIGRFLAQMTNGETEKLSQVILEQKESIKRIVKEGYRRYLKIYEVDIPLYDKLYEEFDNWRKAGRYPMEVYLGRDGIYAYLGRRAQEAARLGKLGKEKRKIIEAQGDVIEINPRYVVYPRYFRDNINYETKRAFLEQEGISREADPLFYDTGYTGTIPEQIMRIMDFDPADIEERIRLLSAPTLKRRVKGIKENARGEIIEYIEHNAKTEDSAVGLILNEETGRIKHAARPVGPEEQFYFMMIKQAIARHYFIKERVHYQPPETKNVESEHYFIRIRKEYKDLFPAEFLQNPKTFFEQYGERLKGGKEEGPYPDEEVILFQLTDGTEIIAKRVELRKSKEARKEFMILIAAKKAGLQTAEPVGFLAGKENKDGSYLLMDKIEGTSGRKFEKDLRASERYTEEQIISIMKTVADKLKALAKLFREKLNIDKRWRIKDTIIQFNEKTGEVEDVIPIDWERVKTYDPNKPKEIDEVE